MKYILACIIIVVGFLPLLCSTTVNTMDLVFFLFTLIGAITLMFFIHKSKQRQKKLEKNSNDIEDQKQQK